MPNPITDPGHELDSAAWVVSQFSASAARMGPDSAEAHAGSFWFQVEQNQGGSQSVFGQQLTIPDTDKRTLQWYWRQDLRPGGDGTTHRHRLYDGHVSIDLPPGSGTFYDESWNTKDDIPDGWTQQESGLVSPPSTNVTLVVSTVGLGGTLVNSRTFLDSWGFLTKTEAAVARGMYDGWTALKNGIASIDGAGSGYWNDFTGRVFGKLLLPGESEGMPTDFYVCLPFADEPETFPDHQRMLRSEWTQTVFVFVRDDEDAPDSTGQIELVAKVRDDLVRYFLTDPTLGGAVDDVALLPAVRTAGVHEDYGEYQLPLQITQYIDAARLGPDA